MQDKIISWDDVMKVLYDRDKTDMDYHKAVAEYFDNRENYEREHKDGHTEAKI